MPRLPRPTATQVLALWLLHAAGPVAWDSGWVPDEDLASSRTVHQYVYSTCVVLLLRGLANEKTICSCTPRARYGTKSPKTFRDQNVLADATPSRNFYVFDFSHFAVTWRRKRTAEVSARVYDFHLGPLGRRVAGWPVRSGAVLGGIGRWRLFPNYLWSSRAARRAETDPCANGRRRAATGIVALRGPALSSPPAAIAGFRTHGCGRKPLPLRRLRV